MKTSKITGFYNMTVEERRALVAKMHTFSDEEMNDLFSTESLPVETADKLIENVVGTFPLPLGLGLNILINGKVYVVPMAIEEPSVVASASYIAKIVREAGACTTEATERMMIRTTQGVGCPDKEAAKEAVLEVNAA